MVKGDGREDVLFGATLPRSPLLPQLRQHLRNYPLWDEWKSAMKLLANLAPLTNKAAGQLATHAFRLLIPPMAGSSAPGQRQLELVVANPLYRDKVSAVLKPLAFLLGAELVRRCLDESKGTIGRQFLRPVVDQFTSQMEDQLQRVPVSADLRSLGGEEVRAIAGRLWTGTDPVPYLAAESVTQILELWDGWATVREGLSLMLLSLARQTPFPGVCSACKAD